MCRTGKTYATCGCGQPVLCTFEYECRDCAAKTLAWMADDEDE